MRSAIKTLISRVIWCKIVDFCSVIDKNVYLRKVFRGEIVN